MRNVSIAFRVLAIVAVFSISAIGQQPNLIYPATAIDLPLEPIRTPVESTLADAARTNNFPLFDALYKQGGDETARFAELHAFWTWSMTDPVGAFYGDEMHAKLAAEYPGYAEYIADYGIIDSHGRAFYPSAETRTFLLKQAMEASVRTVVATKSEPKPAVIHKVAETKAPVVEVVETVPMPKAEPVPAPPLPAVSSVAAAAPAAVVVAHAAPPVTPPVTQAPKPVEHRPAPAPVKSSDSHLAGGLTLIIAGLLALGMLTLMLRTPREDSGTKIA